LTAFSVSLASIVPNNLDPVDDAANAAHAGFIYTMIGLFTFCWVFAMYWSWHANRKASLNQIDAFTENIAAYQVMLTNLPNAVRGSPTVHYMTLIGSKGRSERMVLGRGLKAGSIFIKTLLASDVGVIESVILSHSDFHPQASWGISGFSVYNVMNRNGLIINTPSIIEHAGTDLSGQCSLI